MDALKSLIAEGKQRLEKYSEGEKKWIRRTDIARQRRAAVTRERTEAERQSEQKEVAKLQHLSEYLDGAEKSTHGGSYAEGQTEAESRVASHEPASQVSSRKDGRGGDASSSQTASAATEENNAQQKIGQSFGGDELRKSAVDSTGDGRHRHADKKDTDVNKTREVEDEDDEDLEPPVPKVEVVRKLRRMRQPITLFGETDMMRYHRLCQYELLDHEDELMGGQHNVLLQMMAEGRKKRDRRDYEDEEDEDEEEEKHAGGKQSAAEDNGDSDFDSDEEADAKKKQRTRKQNDDSKDTKPFDGICANMDRTETLEAAAAADRVKNWIKNTLREWDEELVQRNDNEKKTPEGKLATALHRQTRKDLKPLLRKLKHNSLEPDVLDKVHRMTLACENKEYVLAHDIYIQLAIGNAAWPMGVTMVGIHERAGRSKIFTSEVAHILNDETTRKYIQMFKRLMSFAQKRYPTDPSKMVNISTFHV